MLSRPPASGAHPRTHLHPPVFRVLNRYASPVLSVGRIAAGTDAARYYTEQIERGGEDYYVRPSDAGDEPRGEWTGVAAEALGLEGNVAPDALRAMLRGENPADGIELRRIGAGAERAGFDLTFSAPKSVSLLEALGDERMREGVRAAHDVAVCEAIGYVEDEAVKVRRGKAGVDLHRIDAQGLVAARFRHFTSRAGDPQTHSHVVVANYAQGVDGRWSALDGRLLFQHAKTAGYLYQSALRRELTAELGVEWGPVRNGAADLAGVPDDVLRHFSQRRVEILDSMSERGSEGPGAAQAATLSTRKAKSYDVTAERLRDEHAARADELGHGPDAFAALVDRAASRAPVREELVGELRRMIGSGGLTRQAATFDRRDVLQAIASVYPHGAYRHEIEALADAFLAADAVLEVEPHAARLAADTTLRTETGQVVPADAGPRYTTADMLSVERALLEGAERRREAGVALASEAAVDTALGRRDSVTPDQAEMVRRLTGEGHGIVAVRAPAGAGKGFGLDVAREAWEASGVRVIGASVAAQAAKNLELDTGMPSGTIARLEMDLSRGEHLEKNSVLVVDEAGMAGTRELGRLAAHAEAAGAKLVLVGDDRQLPEIDAGGAFRALAERPEANELHTVMRAREQWDRDAQLELRAGDPDRWRAEADARGRINAFSSAEEARATLTADWWQRAQAAGVDQVAMIAKRRADVFELNLRARAFMRAAGRLGPEELRVDARAFAVGDRVVARRNDPTVASARIDGRRGVLNGDRGAVEAVDGERQAVTVALDGGGRVELGAAYMAQTARDVGLDWSYAVTGHGVQGATLGLTQALVTGEEGREWFYVANSRHRDEGRVYAVAREPDEPTMPELERPASDPLEELMRGLRHEERQELAAAVAERTGVLKNRSSAELRRLHEHLGRTVEVVAPAQAERAALLERRVRFDAERRAAAELLQAAEDEQAALGRRDRGRRAELEQDLDAHRTGVAFWKTETLSVDRRLEELPTPEDWLDDHAEEAATYVASTQVLEQRDAAERSRALRALELDPPEHVRALIGERPDSPLGRETWTRAARTVERYRFAFLADPARSAGLGPEPRDAKARRAWRTAAGLVQEARAAQNQPPLPGFALAAPEFEGPDIGPEL